jgi:preprotein translocase subunit SecG
VGIVKISLYVLLLLSSIFLILLVLIQRGRGGGLAGALGGMGGYSAFGTRAGDMFTRITVGTACFWILLAMALARMNLVGSDKYTGGPAATASEQLPAGTGAAGETPVSEGVRGESEPGSENKAPEGDF